jgi:hypothetical protein
MSPKRRLLLDTNMLLLWLVGSHDRRRIKGFKRTEQFEAEDFDLLNQLIIQCGLPIATTSHVLTEVSNQAGQLTGKVKRACFQILAGYVQRAEELHAMAKSVVSDPVFIRLGLTDVAIAHLAQDQLLSVITVDFDLWQHLMKIGVKAHNFNHLRSSRLVPEDY